MHPVGLRVIPRSIWALGLVSMFMDISSEMIHALLPIYLVVVLGTGTLAVGFIEGIAEATAAIVKVFSGTLSDYLGKRKPLAVLGYGLSALTKPVFPLASTVGWLVAARFVDRIGKGVRGAPRDALIGDLAPAHLRGACFGLRQSLDTVGAFLGPLAAIALMAASGDDFRLVFWVAVVPAFIAVALLVLGVEEPARAADNATEATPISRADLGRLGGLYWCVVAVSTVLTLARFSEAFLVLRAQHLGLAVALVPMVLVVMNVVYAASAYPAGALSDRVGRWLPIGCGVACLIAGDIALALADGLGGVALGVVLWGLHMGLTQGLVSTLVADAAPPALRGTAFGMLNLAGGAAMLLASVLAGVLWDWFGPATTFLAGAALSGLALLGLLALRMVALRPSTPT